MGRDEVYSRMHEFVRSAAVGGGALLMVGDLGTGKSLLLEVASDLATDLGTQVLRAEGVEFETDVSHAVLNQFLVPTTDNVQTLSALHRSAPTVALGLEEGPMPDRLIQHRRGGLMTVTKVPPNIFGMGSGLAGLATT